MCSAPNVFMFVYILIGTQMVPLTESKSQFIENSALVLKNKIN